MTIARGIKILLKWLCFPSGIFTLLQMFLLPWIFFLLSLKYFCFSSIFIQIFFAFLQIFFLCFPSNICFALLQIGFFFPLNIFAFLRIFFALQKFFFTFLQIFVFPSFKYFLLSFKYFFAFLQKFSFPSHEIYFAFPPIFPSINFVALQKVLFFFQCFCFTPKVFILLQILLLCFKTFFFAFLLQILLLSFKTFFFAFLL